MPAKDADEDEDENEHDTDSCTPRSPQPPAYRLLSWLLPVHLCRHSLQVPWRGMWVMSVAAARCCMEADADCEVDVSRQLS